MKTRLCLVLPLGLVWLFAAACYKPGPETKAEQLPACATQRSGPLAVVVGARANQPAPALPPAVLDLVDKTARTGNEIVFFRDDGDPTEVDSEHFQSAAQNDIAYAEDLKKFMAGFAAGFVSDLLNAATPEANPLEALARAAERVGPGGTVVLFDSGLQTVPPLDFTQKGMLDSDVPPLVDFLATHRQLPHLDNVTVVYVGLAKVDKPQASLNTAQREMLTSLWLEIAGRGGSTCIGTMAGNNRTTALTGSKPVTPVTIPPPPVPPTGPACGSETKLPDAGSVKFVSDEATFLHPEQARATLQGFAATIIRDGYTVELIGTTSSAGNNEAGRVQLSQQRADAVKAILVELGVPADRISTKGVGYRYDGYVNDRGANGELLPDKASLNRNVIIRWLAPSCS